jgi:two-component system sensor histidine kinase SenX3
MVIAPLRGTYALLAAAAVASVIGMLLTARAARARAALATMQSDFVCGVTHELKTPLALIRLMAETLGQGRYNSLDTVRDYARMLSQESWHLTRLIDNLLTFARVTNSAGQHQFEPIEVAELVEDVLDRFHPQLAEKSFAVTVDVPAELPRIRGDRTMLLQALDNLVDNAIKYSKGCRVLKVHAGTHDGHLRLQVADAGVGIAPEEIPRVFDKFYRGRVVGVSGSGLGLSIVKRIVEENGGLVEISSVLGEGTSVWLVLPVDS